MECYKCSGSIDDCNNVTAKTQNCLAGQDRCSKVMITKDGEQNVILGCASQDDCDAGSKSCKEAEKQARTTCEATCCQTDNCNTAPEKGELNWNSVCELIAEFKCVSGRASAVDDLLFVCLVVFLPSPNRLLGENWMYINYLHPRLPL